jgi:hypothetical protein
MTINRRHIFTEAWILARSKAKKAGRSASSMFKLALSVVWATVKEAARRAALPARPNAWEMGAPVYVAPGGIVRASALAPMYNGW